MRNIITWGILLVISNAISVLAGYFYFGMKDTEKYRKHWESKPRPVLYIDTCASYQPKN